MSSGKPMNNGAVWCDEHGHLECTARSQRTGGRCHARPIRGTSKCRNHAGKATAVAKAQGEAITAWSALGGSPDISHTEVVLAMLQMSWLRVHVYSGRLRAQVEADGGQPDLGGGAGGGEAGSGTSGLVGHTYSGVKDIGIFATGEAVRGLVQLEAAERDRAVRFAKTAHDMGVADAMVDLARRWGAQAEALLRFVLSGLGHDLADPAVVALVERGLAELETGEVGEHA